jgi:hypothetical protein
MGENKKLKEEFCVFFDVLGTKNKFLTSNFEEEEKLVKDYENFIRDIKEILMNNGFKENEIKLFSDNIFINFPNTTLKEMYDVFRCLAYIQIKAIEKYNFLLRGGVEYSTIYNEKDIVIGKGLVEAVELEKKANYPIIMLGEKAKEEHLKKIYEESKKYMKEEILNDKDMYSAISGVENSRKNSGTSVQTTIRVNDKIFINYLMISYEENKEDFFKIISKHKNFIVESLRSDENKFYEKNNNVYIKNLRNILEKYFNYEEKLNEESYIQENLNQIEEEKKAFIEIIDSEKEIFEKYIEIYDEKIKKQKESLSNIEKSLAGVKKSFKREIFKVQKENKKIEEDLNIRKKYIYLYCYHNKIINYLNKFEKNRYKDQIITLENIFE